MLTQAMELAFHPGERAVQARVGMDARIAELGPRVIRDHMPEQHRHFFAQLPFILVGSVDAQGQPWASVLHGPPGFLATPDEHRLTVATYPTVHDPLHANLRLGAPIGLLGIEPHTRRRNRMNGLISAFSPQGFSVRVQQSFGNCPKYIQAREARVAVDAVVHPRVQRAQALDAAARALLARTDTFFIATSHPGGTTADRAQGVDVSHRGGKPGFIHVDADGHLTVPEFAGNFFFNTLGNLVLNPRAGLLVIDFDSGDLLYLKVQVDILWDDVRLASFAGAQRLLSMRVQELLRVPGGLPLRWGAAQPSPTLAATGSWDNTQE